MGTTVARAIAPPRYGEGDRAKRGGVGPESSVAEALGPSTRLRLVPSPCRGGESRRTFRLTLRSFYVLVRQEECVTGRRHSSRKSIDRRRLIERIFIFHESSKLPRTFRALFARDRGAC